MFVTHNGEARVSSFSSIDADLVFACVTRHTGHRLVDISFNGCHLSRSWNPFSSQERQTEEDRKDVHIYLSFPPHLAVCGLVSHTSPGSNTHTHVYQSRFQKEGQRGGEWNQENQENDEIVIADPVNLSIQSM